MPTHNPTPAALAIGQRAYSNLVTATDLKWFNTGPRVRGWAVTLTNAYAALADGEPDALVALPEGVSIQGRPIGEDTAQAVLDAFDDWLGRGIVVDSFEAAQTDDDVDLGFATVPQGIALAIARGW